LNNFCRKLALFFGNFNIVCEKLMKEANLKKYAVSSLFSLSMFLVRIMQRSINIFFQLLMTQMNS